MTPSELLQPRYKCIADYPGSHFEIGDILIQDKNHKNNYWIEDNLYTERYPNNYPHLFKKLEWWEDKEEIKMPRYLKFKSGLIEKVLHYSCNNSQVLFNTHVSYMNTNGLEPATESEYINQLK